MPAYRYCTQRVIYTEYTGKICLCIYLNKSLRPEGNTQISLALYEFYILSHQVITFIKSIFLDLTRMSLKDIPNMLIVPVKDPHLALLKKHALAFQIMLKACMFIRPYMIRFNIRKYAQVKINGGSPVQHKPLR